MRPTKTSAAALVAFAVATALSPACESSPDLGRLAGRWAEVDTGRAFQMNAEGHGIGPFCNSSPCNPLRTLTFPLIVKLTAFDEFLIQYDEGYAGSVGLVPCGPCTLTDDDRHLTCRQQTVDGGFSTCEFDRVSTGAGIPGSPDSSVD